MSKSSDFLKTYGLKWESDRGIQDIYKAVSEDLLFSVRKHNRFSMGMSENQDRNKVMEILAIENGKFVIDDVEAFKLKMKHRALADQIPDGMIKDLKFSLTHREKKILPRYERLIMDEYFGYNDDEKFKYYKWVIRNHKEVNILSEKNYEERARKIVVEEISKIAIEFIGRVEEMELEKVIKYQLIDLMIEDLVDSLQEEKVKVKKNKKGIIQFIKEMANSL